MLVTRRARSSHNAFARRLDCRSQFLAFIGFVVFSAFSAPAFACLCSCEDAATQGKRSTTFDEAAGQYDQVFAGLVISTERTAEPAIGAASSGSGSDEGFWIRSRILVTHIWRGAPPAIAEVWTPSGSSCDLGIIAGFHFVALARTENGRSVARNSECECGVRAAATKMRRTYTKAGIAIIAVIFCVAAIVLTWLGIAIRRLRRSEGLRLHLPFALCFVASALPVCFAIYLTAFQSAVAAIASLVILLFWSKVLMHFSRSDAWRRNAAWLLASAVSVFTIGFLAIVVDDHLGETSLTSNLASSAFWVIVALEVALTLTLLNSLRYLYRRLHS